MPLETWAPWVAVAVDALFAGVLIQFAIAQSHREKRMAELAARQAHLQEHAHIMELWRQAREDLTDDYGTTREDVLKVVLGLRERFLKLGAELGFHGHPKQ